MAASQKVLFVHPLHDTICGFIINSSQYVDNKYMTQLLKYFVEPYALNAHPHVHTKASVFLSSIFNSLLERLSIAQSPQNGSAGDILAVLVIFF
jgi:hypothetical protein